MTFLSPAILWALLALAVPVLVHLYSFRRKRKVLFSHVEFILTLQREEQQQRTLKKWLLLLLRLLAVLALVLAFAGLSCSPDGTGANGPQSVVLLLDNSRSMSVSNEKGLLLQQAKEQAQVIIDALGPDDEVKIISLARQQGTQPFVGQQAARQLLQQLDYTDHAYTLPQLYKEASLWFQGAAGVRRSVYLISDFQTAALALDSLQSDSSWQFRQYWVNLSPGSTTANLYVSSLQLAEPVAEAGRPLSLRYQLHNTGSSARSNINLRLEVGGKAVAITNEQIAAGQRKLCSISYTPAQGGWQHAQLIVEDGQASFDNTRHLALYIPDRAPVLVVEGEQPNRYLNVVLESMMRQFAVKRISYRELAGTALASYKVIVAVGWPGISTGTAEQLAAWVRAGGGLLWWPAAKPDLAAYNQFYSQLNLGSWQALQQYEQPVSSQAPDLAHPLLKPIYIQSGNKLDYDLPAVRQLLPFAGAADAQTHTLLRLQNNQPLLLESRVGDGSVVTSVVMPDEQWTDWPLRSSFAPMLYRIAAYLSSIPEPTLAYTLDSTQTLHLRTPYRDLIRMRPLQGPDVVPTQTARSGSLYLDLPHTHLQRGNYALLQRDSVLQTVALNLPTQESELQTLGPPALQQWLAAHSSIGAQVLPGRADVLRAQLQQQQAGWAIWPWLVVLALCALVAEVAIVRWMP